MPPHRRIGYVFQEGRLFPHLTVRRNLDYGRWMSGIVRDEAELGRIVALLDIDRCSTAGPASCRAANASVSPSAAPC